MHRYVWRIVIAVAAMVALVVGAPVLAAPGDLPVGTFDASLDAGQANAVAPDGSGGYFVGGTGFTRGGQALGSVVHVKADRTVDQAWAGKVTGAEVNDLDVVNGVLYVAGGTGMTVSGQARNGLAAIDVATGNVTAWNPGTDAAVHSLAVQNGVVYVGGEFTTVGGQGRALVAALDATTGTPTSWNPGVGGGGTPIVNAVLLHDNDVYVGGRFTTAAGQARNNAAAIRMGTGDALTWDPDVGGAGTPVVHALELREDHNAVFVGGSFDTVAGQPRRALAEVHAISGAPTTWNPLGNTGTGQVSALAVTGAWVYIGGTFTGAGSPARSYMASADADTGAIRGWDAQADGAVNALWTDKGTLFAGGAFTTFGGGLSRRSAAVDDPAWPLPTVATPPLGGEARAGSAVSMEITWNPQPASTIYSWQRCDAQGDNCTTILRARNRTYTLTAADVGFRVRGTAAVSPWQDGRDPTRVTTALSAVVTEAPPTPVTPVTPPVTQQPPVATPPSPFVRRASRVVVDHSGVVRVRLTLLTPGRYTVVLVNAKNRRIAMLKGSAIAGRTLRRSAWVTAVTTTRARTVALVVRTRGTPTGTRLRVTHSVAGQASRVATFAVPRRLVAPTGRLVQLAPRRAGGTLTLRWRPVRNATRYQLVVRLPGGATKRITTRAPRATLRVPAGSTVRGTIRAANSTGHTPWYALRG